MYIQHAQPDKDKIEDGKFKQKWGLGGKGNGGGKEHSSKLGMQKTKHMETCYFVKQFKNLLN